MSTPRVPQDDASLFAAAVASIPKDAIFDKQHPAASDEDAPKRSERDGAGKPAPRSPKSSVSQQDQDRALFASMVGDVRKPR